MTIKEAIRPNFPDKLLMLRMVLDGYVHRNGKVITLHDLKETVNTNDTFQFGKRRHPVIPGMSAAIL